MEQKVYFQLKLKKHIERHCAELGEGVIGFLISVPLKKENELHIISAISCTNTDPRVIISEVQNSMLTMPGGFTLCGVFFKCQGAHDPANVKKVFDMVVPKDINPWFGESKYILAVDCENSANTCLYFNLESNDIDKVPFEVTNDNFQSFIPVRLKATVPMNFEYSALKDDIRFDIQAEFIQLENKFKSDVTAYHIKQSNVILTKDLELTRFSEDNSCSELFNAIKDADENIRKKRRKAGDFSEETIHVGLLNQNTGEPAMERSVSCAPLIHHEHKYYKEVSFKLPIDVVLYMHAEESVCELHGRLTDALVRQLFCMANYLLRNVKQMDDLHTPEPFHFQPPQLCHVVTVVYPNKVEEESLTNTRQLLHRKLMLPQDQPYLRRLNAHIWPDETIPGGYLINVHNGIKPSGGGAVNTVSGRYSYHHYMQDRMNDDGWGCAYRSLQTLISWFRFQGYTTKTIPTHTEIQQTLVDIGDKPEKIVGSKSWIGSVEVGMVLEKWIDVQSKILFVNSGADMSTKGRDLAMHFENHGTPVMIGGGVLAHTILGVDFNEVTGDVKFLILDPHYTGGEDIKTIQDKGWCGWKGCDIWDQKAHYNMCMPQKPKML